MTMLPALARALLEASDDPSLVIERHRVLAANRAARALLGAGIEGNDIRLSIRHPDALDAILEHDPPAECDLVGIGGADRPWHLSVRPLGQALRLVRLVDQSGLRSAERMRVDFVANASHELRTPLATIAGYAETVADDEPLDEATRRRFGSIIGVEAARMMRLIEELMSLSKIEADRFRPASERVDLEQVVRAAADECGELVKRNNAAIEIEASPDLPAIAGDRRQLAQLVTNLLTNALRYGCDSGNCEVRIRLEPLPGRVRLTVADQGEGVAADHLARLTERFYRVDAARSRDSGGTGLGLAIVKHIAERHRATLEFDSAPGKGMTVAVSFPAG